MNQEDTHHDFHRASQDCMYCQNRADLVIEYMEVRVFFDRYVEVSLKQNTRKKRVTYVAATTAGHVVLDGMSINTISLKQLLSCTSTKHCLTCYLGQG